MTDIYTLLRSGATPEEIAAEFAKNLNEAETRYKEELAAEEAKRRELEEQAALAAAKQGDFADVIHAFLSAIGRHYPELGIKEEDITDEVCAAMADLIILSLDSELKRAGKWLPKHILPVKLELKTKKPATEAKSSDPFETFFAQFGL